LPEVNPFITKNFDVTWTGEKVYDTTPKTIRDDGQITFNYMQDKYFLIPKAHMNIAVNCNSENYYHDNRAYALVQLWMIELNEFIIDYGYHADLAKCQYDISRTSNGMEITVSGYSGAIPKFLDWLYKQLEAFNSHFDQKRWTDMHSNTLRNIRNSRSSEPYSLGMDLADACFIDRFVDIEYAISGFENIDWEMYKYFKPRWMKHIRIEGLLEGNVLEETGLQWCNEIVTNFDRIYKPTWMTRDDMNQSRIVQLPKETNWIIANEIELETQGNCAYLGYWEMGQGSKEFAAPGMIIENLLSSKAFEELRTQQQLGYVVWHMNRVKKDVYYGVFIIQSDVQEPNYIHARVVEFLETMKKYMAELTEEEFVKCKTSLANGLAENFKTIPQRCNTHWAQCGRQDYVWNYKDVIEQQLLNATLADVQDKFTNMFFVDKKVLEVHIVNPKRREESRKLREERAAKDSSVKLASNSKSFMRKMPLYTDNWSFKK